MMEVSTTNKEQIEPRRVLVVDDDPDTAESLAMVLEASGHEVRTACDGPRALEMSRDFHPDVVVLDIGLPDMDGYEIARRLRLQHGSESMTLLALTGYGRDEDRRLSVAAGFDNYLVKPVNLEVLEALIRSHRR
jgi:two-component system, chemotaxis family, CheB/CheR fusion protein